MRFIGTARRLDRALLVSLLFLRGNFVGALYWPAEDAGESLANDTIEITDSTHDPNLFHFISRPDLAAPKWQIETLDQDALAPGYWFVTPYQKNESRAEAAFSHGPHIYRSDGELIWSGAPMVQDRKTWDFHVIDFHGSPGLSYIDPTNSHESGIMLDDGYRITHEVDLRGTLDGTNLHEFKLVDNGKHALTLTKIPGKSTVEESKKIGFIGNCTAQWEGFKEVNVETNHVTFEWNPHGRIGLNESTHATDTKENMCNDDWDLLHLNSIDKFPDGDYLLSSRHTDTIYKISHKDGHIVWRLGGKLSNFKKLDDTVFGRQHQARVQSQNETHTLISFLDNAKGNGDEQEATHDFSRGLLLSLDTNKMTVEMLQHYDHPGEALTPARGGVQFLPNGNALVCFSNGVLLAEYSRDGTMLMKAFMLQHRAKSYRAFKSPWVGKPSRRPDVHAARQTNADGDKETVIHVSWNGATEVATWKAYKTDFHGVAKKSVAEVSNQGFESVLTYGKDADYIVVEAFDADGRALSFGQSNVVAIEDEPEPLPVETAEEPVPVPVQHSAVGSSIIQPLLGVLTGICVIVIVKVLLNRRRRTVAIRQDVEKYELMDGEYEDDEGGDFRLSQESQRSQESKRSQESRRSKEELLDATSER